MDVLNTLMLRAELLKKTRQFFDKRGVLEVETPLLYPSFSTDPYLTPFISDFIGANGKDQRFYLQSSPENCMKRLIGLTDQSIFQICKAFRNSEKGRQHNPEFTLLEWYRVGYDYLQLSKEVSAYLKGCLVFKKEVKASYCELFEHHFDLNPLSSSLQKIQKLFSQHGFSSLPTHADKEQCLDLLLDEMIRQNYSEVNTLLIIFDYPAQQSQMAMLHPENNKLVQRFECYVGGIELANGYQELTDAVEQKKRFNQDNLKRKSLGFETVPVDEAYLKTLNESLPSCAGVALGLDRLLMLMAGKKTIQDILPFPHNQL